MCVSLLFLVPSVLQRLLVPSVSHCQVPGVPLQFLVHIVPSFHCSPFRSKSSRLLLSGLIRTEEEGATYGKYPELLYVFLKINI
jgi:hypothetical protein